MIRAALIWFCLALPAFADGRAVINADASRIDREADEAEIELALSHPVPWRVGLREGPWRLVIDLSDGDTSDLAAGDLGDGVIWGRIGPDAMRVVIPLEGEMGIESAAMVTGDAPAIRVTLSDAVTAQPEPGGVAAPAPSLRAPQPGDGPLVVVLDPGHGGIDPGAERGGAREAELMLRFARELAEVLEQSGHRVVLTRETDVFVSLRGRASVARAAGAHLMISLHADAVRGGGASGATAYTLRPSEGDEITAELAERQARGDRLMGVELEGEGDEIARILIDLARTETAPRADALAGTIVAQLGQAGLRLHKRPRLGAEFTVLKTPDIPTVLLELGFMSDEQDLQNLLNRDWRARTAVAVARAVSIWAERDAAQAALRRR